MANMNSAQMKDFIKRTGNAVIWEGRCIDDPKDVPTDDQIAQAREKRRVEQLSKQRR